MLTGNGESLADANPFRYCGYQFDKETGFYYLKYRYYIPSLGRFLTRDPMMTGNRYVYCRNNPVNFVDYLGLAPIVDDYIIQLPNKKIIDTRTGKVVSNNKWFRGTKYESGPITAKGGYIEKVEDTSNLPMLKHQVEVETGIAKVEGEHRYLSWYLSGPKAEGSIGASLLGAEAEAYATLVEVGVATVILLPNRKKLNITITGDFGGLGGQLAFRPDIGKFKYGQHSIVGYSIEVDID